MTMDDYANLKVAAKVLYEAADKLMTYSDECNFDTQICQYVSNEIDVLAAETFELYERVSKIIAEGEIRKEARSF